MPNAPTHDLITVGTAIAANIAYFRMTPHPDSLAAGFFTGAFLLAGYACAGDLDLNSREYRRWGWFRFIWWPYRRLVPHRSWISHGLVAGGVIRIAYLAIVSTLVFWLGLWGFSLYSPGVDATGTALSGWTIIAQWARDHPYPVSGAAAGFILAGTAHSIADVVFSRLKRRLRIFR